MPVNAFMKLQQRRKRRVQAKGLRGRARAGLEIQSWDWEIEAESRLDQRRRRGRRQAEPGQAELRALFRQVVAGDHAVHLPRQVVRPAELNMCKMTGAPIPEQYFKMMMKNAYITKVSNSGTEEGNVTQKVECVQGDLHRVQAAEERRQARFGHEVPLEHSGRLGRTGIGREVWPALAPADRMIVAAFMRSRADIPVRFRDGLVEHLPSADDVGRPDLRRGAGGSAVHRPDRAARFQVGDDGPQEPEAQAGCRPQSCWRRLRSFLGIGGNEIQISLGKLTFRSAPTPPLQRSCWHSTTRRRSCWRRSRS